MDNFIINKNQYTEKQARELNPQTLAFIGDGVYTLFIRTLVLKRDAKSAKLHALANEWVNAKGQSNVLEKVLPHLNEDEVAIYKRGRNYKTAFSAKSSSVIEYKRATGLEALIGYLYLTGSYVRLNEILNICVEV